MLFLKDDIFPEEKGKANKVWRIKSCTSTPFLGLICYVSILKQWSYS